MIRKKNTKWRKAIPANERLAITLRFLATGDSFKSLHYLFKVSPQLISEIVPEVCNARKPSMDAKEIRKEFAEYFITSGKVPWQDQYC
nr:unnamed protein product [Callosobruchus chinensis]